MAREFLLDAVVDVDIDRFQELLEDKRIKDLSPGLYDVISAIFNSNDTNMRYEFIRLLLSYDITYDHDIFNILTKAASFKDKNVKYLVLDSDRLNLSDENKITIQNLVEQDNYREFYNYVRSLQQ